MATPCFFAPSTLDPVAKGVSFKKMWELSPRVPPAIVT